MKKMLLLFFIFCGLMQLRAGDTLTVRQVFNFSVGDTFDYKVYQMGYFPAAGNIPYNTCLMRYIIDSKTVSQNNDTIYYSSNLISVGTCNLFYIYPINNIYTNLDSNIFSIIMTPGYDSIYDFHTDTLNRYQVNTFRKTLASSRPQGSSTYFSQNHLTYMEKHGCYIYTDSFEAGNMDVPQLPFWGDSYFQLIYFSNGYESFGIPYYMLDGENEISNDPVINMYPNPCAGPLHIQIPDAGQTKYQFIITDLLGKEVYSYPISQPETNMDISKLNNGIYIWRLSSGSEIIKTGKIVKD